MALPLQPPIAVNLVKKQVKALQNEKKKPFKMSCYLLYFHDKRANIVQQFPGEKKSVQDISRFIGAEWKNQTAEIKALYTKLATLMNKHNVSETQGNQCYKKHVIEEWKRRCEFPAELLDPQYDTLEILPLESQQPMKQDYQQQFQQFVQNQAFGQVNQVQQVASQGKVQKNKQIGSGNSYEIYDQNDGTDINTNMARQTQNHNEMDEEQEDLGHLFSPQYNQLDHVIKEENLSGGSPGQNKDFFGLQQIDPESIECIGQLSQNVSDNESEQEKLEQNQQFPDNMNSTDTDKDDEQIDQTNDEQQQQVDTWD